MIDIAILRKEPDKVKKGVESKNGDPGMVDAFLALDEKWRKLTTELETLRAEQNELSKKRDIEGAKANKERIKAKEEEIAGLDEERKKVWMKIPNMPSEDTPAGKSEEDNKVIKTWGEPKKMDFEPKDHLELGESLGILNVKKAGEVTGPRFSYYLGDLVKLEFALVQYCFDVLTDPEIVASIADKVRPGYNRKPFVPVVPPQMIREEVMQKMARLEPKNERYGFPDDGLYMIGSAEHTLGPLHMDEILREEELPIRYVGFSTAFRREAGAYGKDTRGILRMHQFDKVELESFTLPEDSIAEQDFLIAVEEYLMQQLNIPYRLVMCCTGDQGDPDARHIDLESWMPGQDKYRETHSADLMTDYQARRLNTRVKRKDGKTEFVHMNDATAIAMSRTPVAIIENYQTKDGKIEVPKVLQKYVGKEIIG